MASWLGIDPPTLFKLTNELIVALSQLLWPVAVIVALLLFKPDISDLLLRLRKGKVLGFFVLTTRS